MRAETRLWQDRSRGRGLTRAFTMSVLALLLGPGLMPNDSGWKPDGIAYAATNALLSASAEHVDFVQENTDLAPLEAEQTIAWIALPPSAGVSLTQRVVEERFLAWPEEPEARQTLRDRIEANPTILSEPSWVRDQFAVSVSSFPLSIAPDGGLRLHLRTEFSVRIERRPVDIPLRVADGKDPFEPVYRGLFLNYEDGRAWRRALSPPPVARGGDYFSSTDQPWIRLACTAEDLYQVTATALEQAGVNPASIDPETIRLFSPVQLPLPEARSVHEVPGWMDEVAILVEAGDDGSFDASDRIVFLGHGPDTWYTNKGVTPPGLEAFARDPSANENTYWLTWGGSFAGTPKRMAVVDGSSVDPGVVTRVRDTIHLEEDRIYDPRPRERATLIAAWELYWWRDRVASEEDDDDHLVSVKIPNPVASEDVTVNARFGGANVYPGGVRPDHDLEFQLNGHFIDRRQWVGFGRQDITGTGPWLRDGEDQDFRMILRVEDDPVRNRLDQVHLAYIEATYTRELVARGTGGNRDRIDFFAGGVEGVQSFEVKDFTTDDLLVVDASEVAAPRMVIPAPMTQGALRFKVGLSPTWPARFLVRPHAALANPRIQRDTPPEGGYLRERTDGVQMIIIAGPGFEAQSERLADYRRTHFPGRASASVAVIDVQDVFDEFSFGRHDPVAIRNFLQFVRFRWTGGVPADAPAYVVLFGDGHRDPRGILTEDPDEFVPTYTRYWDSRYQSSVYEPRFSSDDFFGFLDGPTDVGMDLYIGRIAVRTAAEARIVVDKTLAYADLPSGLWHNRITFVADDLCQGTVPDLIGWGHTSQTERAAKTLPEAFELDKIYMVESGGTECVYTNKPAVAAALLKSMNDGTLIVNYAGHGSESQISDERIFEVSSVGSLTNRDHPFLLFTASCSVGKFDSSSETLCEALMRHPNGGAISVLSASSIAESGANNSMNLAFYRVMFPEGAPGSLLSLGAGTVLAKLSTNSGLNELRYALHGDPALTLAAPQDTVAFELFDPISESAVGDTLRRGTPVEIRGRVLTLDGVERTDFNGSAQVHVFDSSIVREGDGFQYELAGSPIYRGTATVENGRFTTQFFVPSALRIGDLAEAAIYVYAASEGEDASGSNVQLVVPEEPPPSSEDRQGPRLDVVLAGDLGAIPPGAELTATMFDSSGVNVTGLVSSRSVVLRIEDEGQVVFAEDLASRVLFGDDFRAATLSYPLPTTLPEGRRYDAVLAVSDNRNNRSEARLSFFLSGTGASGFQLARVFNLPNPAEEETHFFGEINQEAWVTIDVFTLGGRRLARLPETRRTPVAFANEGVAWDGRDGDGDRLANGVYFYKVTARPTGGGAAVTRTERLVYSR